MQTFLPYPDFSQSAACLDRLRLGKQRVEAMQILRTLGLIAAQSAGLDPACARVTREIGWRNHPAVKMWQGYETALRVYGNAMVGEWVRRGYENTIAFGSGLPHLGVISMPHWLGDERLHASHRAALLAKNPDHYGQFGWTEQPKIDYWWPTRQEV